MRTIRPGAVFLTRPVDHVPEDVFLFFIPVDLESMRGYEAVSRSAKLCCALVVDLSDHLQVDYKVIEL